MTEMTYNVLPWMFCLVLTSNDVRPTYEPIYELIYDRYTNNYLPRYRNNGDNKMSPSRAFTSCIFLPLLQYNPFLVDFVAPAKTK
jgi:hypothetical protein